LICAGLVVAAGVAVHPQSATRALNVCHAGSLTAAFADVEKAFAKQYPDVTLTDVSGGSVTLARRLASGSQACDVYASADYVNIAQLLEPAGLADFTVVFARGRMVLAYLATDPKTQGVARSGAFNPPTTIPEAAPEWYQALLAPDVRIGGAHPFLDPGGYRAHLIFELAQKHYQVASLYNALLEHYAVIPASTRADAAAAPALGREYSFQFTYEHSAAAAAASNSAYRYVRLPDQIDLSNPGNDRGYARAGVTMPGLGIAGAAASVAIPATSVAWGVTIIRKTANQENAIAFVSLLLSPTGTAALHLHGPAPVTPAMVSPDDYAHVPKTMQALVMAKPIAP
jgi:ABC-type molybdate transport system substrate-binding protein